MTTEQKLQAIIGAQVRGGYRRFEPDADEVLLENGKGFWVNDQGGFGQWETSIVAFLLDPEGLRAAYGEAPGGCVLCWVKTSDPERRWCHHCNRMSCRDADEWAAFAIIDRLLSSNGDAAATISTAYDLLPHEKHPD